MDQNNLRSAMMPKVTAARQLQLSLLHGRALEVLTDAPRGAFR